MYKCSIIIKLIFLKVLILIKKNGVDIYLVDFCCIIVRITKTEVINLFERADFIENSHV